MNVCLIDITNKSFTIGFRISLDSVHRGISASKTDISIISKE